MHGLDEIKAMNNNDDLPTLDDIREHVAKGLSAFVAHPPKSGVQIGFLAALVHIARELKEDFTAFPYAPAAALVAPTRSELAPVDVREFVAPLVPIEIVGPHSAWPRVHDDVIHVGRHLSFSDAPFEDQKGI